MSDNQTIPAMTTDQQNKLARIKDALRAGIAMADAATSAPWTDDGTGHMWHEYDRAKGEYDGEHITLGRFDAEDFAFIAHARTFHPLAAKSLLLALEALVKTEAQFTKSMEMKIWDHRDSGTEAIEDSEWVDAVAVKEAVKPAREALAAILAEWPEEI